MKNNQKFLPTSMPLAMEDDQNRDFGNRSVVTPTSNQQHIPSRSDRTESAEMAVESTEQTNRLIANEDIELQHSEESGKAAIVPSENIMPDRRPSDVARDTKRILEIAYGSEDDDDINSDSMEKIADADGEFEDGNTNNQSSNGTGSYNETVELKEGQFMINGYVINPLTKKKKTTTKHKKKKTKSKKDSNKDSTKKPKKKTTKKKKKSDDTNGALTPVAADVSNSDQEVDTACPNSEAESLLNTIEENLEGQPAAEVTDGGKKKKKKVKGKATKKKKKKKKKKVSSAVVRMSAARKVSKRKTC